MHLTFLDKRIRETCELERSGREQLGDEIFEQLQARLADICAAEYLSDLPIPATVIGDNELAIDLVIGCRLVFKPNRAQVSKRGTSVQGQSAVQSVKLLKIEKTDA